MNMYFFGFLSLRGRQCRHRRLEVVRLQVALEVQDLELILLRQGEELAEGRIGLDVLLLHQALGLGVVADLLRH